VFGNHETPKLSSTYAGLPLEALQPERVSKFGALEMPISSKSPIVTHNDVLSLTCALLLSIGRTEFSLRDEPSSTSCQPRYAIGRTVQRQSLATRLALGEHVHSNSSQAYLCSGGSGVAISTWF
jgi:hypothetical protein